MSIRELANQYNQFQHDFGQEMARDFENIVNSLFSPHFKKIANGNELVSERSQLLDQLYSVKDFAGNWSIHNLDIIPSSDNLKSTIRYCLNSDKVGQFEVIAILSANQGQIERIDEVYYQKEK